MLFKDGKHGWCDKDGKLIINPQFGEAYLSTATKLHLFNQVKVTDILTGMVK